jgi:hypothetical protein
VRARRAAALLAVLVVLVGVATYVVVRKIGDNLQLGLPTRACTVDGGSGASLGPSEEPVTLDVTQIANAATIGAVGLRRGMPPQAIVVALATAFQESKLENLDSGDRDSIGLFQQRPSQGWGTPEQLADPRYAANAFYTSLLKVKGWQHMRVTDAAQAVQHSAHPEAYQKWEAKAQVLTRALAGQAPGAVTCTLTGPPTSHGPTAAAHLAASVKLDWGTVKTVSVANLVGLALSARNQTAGWQYAHWLVAHAEQNSVQRVRFAGREWTAKTGAWKPVTDSQDSTTSQRVVAEVFTT